MSIRAKQKLGGGGVLGAVALLAGGAVAACGDDFGSSDCAASHTCAAVGGAGDEGGTASHDAGGDTGGSSTHPAAGAGADSAGLAGSGALVGCTSADDCDNGDPADGTESCNDDGVCAAGNAPPSVVSISPEDTAAGVEPKTEIVITFSEALDPATVSSDNIKVLDGDVEVPGALTYAGTTVTFKPTAPFALRAEYAVTVATDVTDEEGAGLLEQFASAFAIRDGAWHTVDAVQNTLDRLADTLPITDAGDALLAYNVRTDLGHYCPTSARWFNRGKAVTAAKAFTATDIQECRSVAAGANAAGVGAVVWQEDTATYAQQYRSGKWLAAKGEVNPSITTWRFSVGVAPNGALSFFQQNAGPGTTAWRSDSKGVWADSGDSVSTEQALSPAKIAFDKKGNGFAAWRAINATGHEEILVSQYTTAAGKWGTAVVLPGSAAANTGGNYERGVPAIAVDGAGAGLALWVKETGASQSVLMASRYSAANGWGDPVAVSGSVFVTPLFDAPALVFDGETFVAAWSGQEGLSEYVYSARFNMALGQFDAYEQRAPLALHEVRQPQLGADGHHNLLLMWARSNNHTPYLFYQRYVASSGTWNVEEAIADGLVDQGAFFDSPVPMPMSVNAAGLGAVMWGMINGDGDLDTIRLASFY